MAMAEPIMPRPEMGVLKAMTEAMMMTTRLMVLPTAWVTGLTRPSARKATSLSAEHSVDSVDGTSG